jgi:transcriptional regulator with XRE-family HTH domain
MAQATIGERLQQARQQLGLSLLDVSEELNIKKEILGAFEANEFSVELPEVYARGFFISYVRLLNLNISEFLAEYETVTGTTKRTGFTSLGHLKYESGEETPRVSESTQDIQSTSWKRLVIILHTAFRNRYLWLCTIAICATFLFLSGCRSRKKSHISSTEITPLAINEVESIPALMEESVIHVTPFESFTHHNEVNVPQTTIPQKNVTLVASGPVRVFVRTEHDKKQVFSGTLDAGARQSLIKESALQVSFSEGNYLIIECSDGISVRPQTSGRGWIRIP